MRARFVGQDGSLGYRYGQTYDLVVRTSLTGERPTIAAPWYCPYDSWAAFWRNWSQPPGAQRDDAQEAQERDERGEGLPGVPVHPVR